MPGKNRTAGRSSETIKDAGPQVGDPYVSGSGNRGFRVDHYDLELEYKVASNRLSGNAVISATARDHVGRFTLDLAETMSVTRVAVNGKRAAKYAHRSGKLSITPASPITPTAPMKISIKYNGTPKPIAGFWGEVGFEELTEGALCANQPNGAPSWFPCDDHPSSKASYQFSITTESPYLAIANGKLHRTRNKAAMTTRTFTQVEPMATYLATISIGAYTKYVIAADPVPINAVLPPRLKDKFDVDFARQQQMLAAFSEMFGPYPFPEYTVVVTDDDLEIPIEAQGISTFGANHCDGTRQYERLVAHELSHQWFGNSLTLKQWRDIWLHEGFACYSEWLWAQACGDNTTDSLARYHYSRLAAARQDILIGDPTPQMMFDDRVYKRGALTVHALRIVIGDENFFSLLREWVKDNRHGSVTTADFTNHAARYSDRPLDQLWQQWLYNTALPPFPIAI